jgi:hypothetical protein
VTLDDLETIHGSESLFYLHELRFMDAVERVVGWATIDLDRAEREVVGSHLPLGEATATAVPDDDLLGATARLVVFDRGRRLVLLEPKTEGRIAASLARFGEGSVAIYVLVDDFRVAAENLGRRVPLSDEAAGPFGPERLISGPRWGAHLILAGNEDRRPIHGAFRPPRAADDERAVTIGR